jgi:ethanolamine ammonia-lyase large subunit
VPYRYTLRGEIHRFSDLRELLAKANEQKSGDQLAALGARTETERAAAKLVLADVQLGEIAETTLIDDDVTELIERTSDRVRFAELRSMTVGELREAVLEHDFAARWACGWRDALTPEIAAAVAKLMSNKDLVVAAAPLRRSTRCRNTMGEPGVLGARIQPNHPADDLGGVLLSVLDGLLYGCGDAMIGVNPVTESVSSVGSLLRGLGDLIERFQIPTQTSVLAHISTQLAALRSGAPVDLLFQSIGGTQDTNESFGISLSDLAAGREEVLAHHRGRPGAFVGEQCMYFETGQGSALSAGAHHGVDQLTLEARAYGVARAFDPFLVNSVVGFIGPEYLAGARQIGRAGLEDHFVGKLLGLPMGCDVCHTNHVDADVNSNDDSLMLLALAGCSYVMGVPGSDDVMLGYQSTSFQDVASVRELLGLRPAPEFQAWLQEAGLWKDGRAAGPSVPFLAGIDSALAATKSLAS